MGARVGLAEHPAVLHAFLWSRLLLLLLGTSGSARIHGRRDRYMHTPASIGKTRLNVQVGHQAAVWCTFTRVHPPLAHYGTRLLFYREKDTALCSLVDSRRIKPFPSRAPKRLLQYVNTYVSSYCVLLQIITDYRQAQ